MPHWNVVEFQLHKETVVCYINSLWQINGFWDNYIYICDIQVLQAHNWMCVKNSVFKVSHLDKQAFISFF